MDIGVVIPFFQRSAEVLQRSLRSIAAQRLPDGVRVRVVLVDDESPLPADQALGDFILPSPHTLDVLRQPNGGPGAARNTGLDHLSADPPELVAFLDSDDEWRPDHLAHAVADLGQDADFFFCDHDRWYDEKSWFSASEQFQSWLTGKEEAPFRQITGTADKFEMLKGRARFAFVMDYLAQTSTVVYRFSRIPDLRFDPQLRHAGEDNMFWLELAGAARLTRFTMARDVVCGEGVNMFFSSSDWTHPDAVRRLGYSLLFYLRAERRFREDSVAMVAIKRRAWTYQKMVVRVWAARLVKNRRLNASIMRTLMAERPALAATLPLALAAAVVKPKF